MVDDGDCFLLMEENSKRMDKDANHFQRGMTLGQLVFA